MRLISGSYAGLVWAAKKWFRRQGLDVEKISSTLDEIHREFGLKSKLASSLMGPIIYRILEKKQQRLASGWTYEPTTIFTRKTQKPLKSNVPARRFQEPATRDTMGKLCAFSRRWEMTIENPRKVQPACQLSGDRFVIREKQGYPNMNKPRHLLQEHEEEIQ